MKSLRVRFIGYLPTGQITCVGNTDRASFEQALELGSLILEIDEDTSLDDYEVDVDTKTLKFKDDHV